MFIKQKNFISFRIEFVDFIFSCSERVLSLFSFIILHSSGFITVKAKLMPFSCFLFSSSNGSTENIFEFLFWEVYVIISMWMWVLSWIISIILPSGFRSQVSWVSKTPVFDI